MPDISKIQLPSGSVYDVKDATARSAIANINNWTYVVATDAATTPYGVTWDDEGTTITGTLVASENTEYKIYLVPQTHGTGNGYDEYITVYVDSIYSWEKFGSIGMPDLDQYVKNKSGHTGGTAGDLAYKDSVSASYTPQGSVAAPVISVATAGLTTTVNSITDVGSLPQLTTTVTDEILTIGWSAGTLPTKGSDTTVKTGDAAYSADAPAFTGTAETIVSL